MEQAEGVGNLAPAPVFVDDTGRRRILTRRIGRVLIVGFAAYIGLLVMGFARDPRLGPLNLPAIGLSDLGLMIPPSPLGLGEKTERGPSAAEIPVSAAEIAVSAAGDSDRDVRSAPPSGVTAARGSAPTGHPAGSGTTITSTSTTTSTSPRGHSPEPEPTKATTPTTAPSTPLTTRPTTIPAQGPESAKGPDGNGPPGYGAESPGQQRKTTTTTTN